LGLRSRVRSVFGFYTKIVQFSDLVPVAVFGLFPFQQLIFRVLTVFRENKFGPESDNISDLSTCIPRIEVERTFSLHVQM